MPSTATGSSPRARFRRTGLSLALLTLLLVASWPALAQQPAALQPVFLPRVVHLPNLTPPPDGLSYWGMNLYLTKRERINTGDNLTLLRDTALQANVRWTREELPWDLIEPSNGTFVTVYDEGLRRADQAGLGIIGMLLTTPAWARDPSCASNYWCPPANVNEYAQFAGGMVERYDGDGVNDAPGSPRVAVWQIWNEPNDTALWPDLAGGPNVRKQRYGDMLVAAYNAIKAADPSATVLTGGTYIYDGSCAGGVCDGLNFFNAAGGVFQQVPAARQAFDAFAIHPYIPTERPDAPNIPRIITVEGRIIATRNWLNDPAIGRSDAPIWITEIGWCTTGGACPGGVAVSEEAQANYLVRSMVIAQQLGVVHTSWFQFEDAFNNPNQVWGNAAIVRNYDGNSYPAKPAYNAYRTLAAQIGQARPAGTGVLHTHVYDPNQPYSGSGGTYHYRYVNGGSSIDVLWRPTDTINATFPVIAGKRVVLVDRDGNSTTLTPSGNSVAITISERPILIVQSDP